MQKRNKFLIGGLGALVLVATGASIFTASAYRGDFSKTGPNFDPERHAKMEEAFNSNDYQAWKDLMQGRGRVSEIINENNFARFAEMHKLMKAGDTQKADEIRKELGLGQGKMMGKGNGQGRKGGNCPFRK